MTTRRVYAHVIQRYYPFRGGSERYFQAFSERFARDGARVQVVTTNAWDLEYFWDSGRERIDERSDTHNGVEIRRVPVRHLPAAALTHRAIRRAMAESSRFSFPLRRSALRAGSRFGPWLPGLFDELLCLDRPHLVNSANIAFESVIATAARYARTIDVPHMVTPFLHLGESDESKVRRYYAMPHQLEMLRRAEALLLLTEIESDFLSSMGVDEQKMHVVGAGIDVAAVTGGDGNAIRRRLGIEGPIVLSLGAAAYDKGTIHLIDAVRRLRREGRAVELVLAGPIMTDVDRFIRSLDDVERRNLHVLGFVSDCDRRDLLAAADILALPSRTESFGLVFMEAWANDKPVVGARAGAIPAVVAHGEDGLLVEFGDMNGLTRAIDDLVSSPTTAIEMGRKGRLKVVTEEEWFDRVRSVYAEVLGPHDGSSVREA